jgi:hypothetical protein
MLQLGEAKKIARVVELAEGGCGACLVEAARELNKVFPRFTWKIVEPWTPVNPMWPQKPYNRSLDVVLRAVEAPALPPPGRC